KWLDLLKQMVPTIDHVAVMFNPETAPQSKFFVSSIESAAAVLRMRVVAAPVRSTAEIESAVARLAQGPSGGLVVLNDAFMTGQRKVLVEATTRYRIPTISPDFVFVREGGLMGYHAEIIDQFRQAGVYADRILRGSKPGDLPVQAATKFTLTINLK